MSNPSDASSRRPAGLEPVAALGATAPVGARTPLPAALPFAGSPVVQPVVHWEARAPEPMTSGEALHLLWLVPEVSAGLRQRPAWRSVLDAMDQRPRDGAEDDDARDVLEVMASGAGSEVSQLGDDLVHAIHGGKLTVPLVLTRGQLVLSYDDLARLRATVAIAATVCRAELPSRAHLDLARTLVAEGVAGDIGARVMHDLREAIHRDLPSLPKDFFTTPVERMLIEQRSYRTSEVLGATHICARLIADDQAVASDRGRRSNERDALSAAPAFLPVDAGARLPLSRSLRVRLLANVVPRQDELETCNHAIEVRALARIVSVEGASGAPSAPSR